MLVPDVHKADTISDGPFAGSTLQPVKITSGCHCVEGRLLVQTAEDVVALSVRDIAIDFADVVRDKVLGSNLVFDVQGKGIVRKILRGTDKCPVIVCCIGVIGREQKLSVKPVDAPAIAHHAIVDVLPIPHFAQELCSVILHPFSPSGSDPQV